MSENIKNYVGLSRDHSYSMHSITKPAMNDYNQTVNGLRTSALQEGIDIIMSVVKCGYGRIPSVQREVTNSSIVAVQPLTTYEAQASGTPLFDSIGELIEMFESTPDANDPNVSFLVMAITDGEENSSKYWNKTKLIAKIKQLQATDRWSFIFRVPRGYKQTLVQFGIPEGNILEWDQTKRGVEQSTQATQTAFTEFYTGLKAGKKATRSFYTTDLTEVDVATVKAQLIDVSTQVTFWTVDTAHADMQIRDFCEEMSGAKMLKGAAFYELTKIEKEVQDHKQIALRERSTGKVFIGPAARDLLGLPAFGTVAVHPGNHAGYNVFIQSTSINRKLKLGTNVMYWRDIGIAYKEGKSA